MSRWTTEWLDKCDKLRPLVGVNDRIKPNLTAAAGMLSTNKLYAVDYPYIISYQARTFLENAPISPVDKEKIAHGNAEKVLENFAQMICCGH